MKVALIGFGKMGQTIEGLIEKKFSKKIEVAGKVFLGNSEFMESAAFSSVDVAIDFSAPDMVMDNIRFCMEKGVALVVGTTGWYSHLPAVKELVRKNDGSLFYASNFSVGMNLLFALNKQLAKAMNSLEDYEVEIEEIHHTEKLDAPSGTAITLADDIVWALDRKRDWVNEESEEEEQLRIVSKREPGVKGTHEITYRNQIDAITLKHEAFNRDGFALGAIQAARWLNGKKGFYTMSDMLSF